MKDDDPIKIKVEAWRELGKKYGISLAQLAVQFAYRPKCVSHVSMGCRTEHEVDTNFATSKNAGNVVAAPKELWKEAAEQGLLSALVAELYTQ